jgi:hypothetical protein
MAARQGQHILVGVEGVHEGRWRRGGVARPKNRP